MSISLVDINLLSATSSQNKDLLIAVDVPSGGGFAIAKLKKEDLFKLTGHFLEVTAGAGITTVLQFGDDTIQYLGAANTLFLNFSSVAVSTGSGVAAVQLNDDGSVNVGNKAAGISGSLDMAHVDFALAERAFDLFDLDFQYVSPTTPGTGETFSANRGARSMVTIDADGTLATYTVNFPPDPKSGYTFELYVRDTITDLTCADPAAYTIEDAPTTATNEGFKWVFRGGAFNEWRLIGRTGTELPNYTSVSTNYTASLVDDIIEVTASGQTITLPSAAATIAGFEYAIDNSSAGSITVDTEGAETIQGLATQSVATQSCINVYSNGTNWRIK